MENASSPTLSLSLFQSQKGDQAQNFTPRASVGAEAAVEPFMFHIFMQH